ncbi:MAG: vitamin K epoxide reductase family protein [Synechococcales bacterium]|nr:vitamin K epoxide reductase family protein [Synechococcales bacterium]
MMRTPSTPSSTPWFQQYARPLMVGVAVLGIVDTAYITYEKLMAQGAGLCQGGCSTVLNSPYAELWGQPLALWGLVAYGTIALLAGVPLLLESTPLASTPEVKKGLTLSQPAAPPSWGDRTWLPLFVATAAMAVFSSYLMYLLAFELHAVCYFCIVSALCSVTLWGLTIAGRTWEDWGQLIFSGVITLMVTLVAALGLYAPATKILNAGPGAIADAAGNVFFYVDAPSGESELALAQHLQATGAKMYGAYWCPHCCEQKQLFGQDAMKQLGYVECAEGGLQSQTEQCRSIIPDVEKQTGEKFGFPTWQINGQFYSGRRSLAELAELSGYQGSQNFQNAFRLCRMP